MSDELVKAAALCDGLRCDMAMLVMPEIFERTWGLTARPFWPAAIARVKQGRPDFTFLAEVYWDLEAALLQQGFDFTYDKRLYDSLRNQHAHPVRDHLSAEPGYQARLARFLENPRRAARRQNLPARLAPGGRRDHLFRSRACVSSTRGSSKAASSVCRSSFAARRKSRRIIWLQSFYQRLLAALPVTQAQPGTWQLLKPAPAWDGNWTWDGFIGYSWQSAAGNHWLAAINYSPHQSQCYFRLPFPDLRGRLCQLRDWFSPAAIDRQGDELFDKGLFSGPA